jgi:hypothetical protein
MKKGDIIEITDKMKYEIKAELLDRIIEKQDELISKLQSMVDSGQDYDRDYHEIYVELQILKSELEGEEKKELFEKVYINSEEDLPKKCCELIYHRIDHAGMPSGICVGVYNPVDTNYWMKHSDWYFRPLNSDIQE